MHADAADKLVLNYDFFDYLKTMILRAELFIGTTNRKVHKEKVCKERKGKNDNDIGKFGNGHSFGGLGC